MGRQISNDSLLKKLNEGEYSGILNCIKNDPDLDIEPRLENQVKVYYKKTLIMTLYPRRQPRLLSKGYCLNRFQPVLDLKLPENYFESAKIVVESHKKDIKKNLEFSIQQKIAKDNRSDKNRYWVLDMEYQFSQRNVTNRIKEKTRFDLVTLDLLQNKIMLLELKQGLGALSGNAGIDNHYKRYAEHVEHPQFKSALRNDIKGIIQSKKQLGLLDFDATNIMKIIDYADIGFGYVFAYTSENELDTYKKQFDRKYLTLYLDAKVDKYILNDEI